MKYHLFITLLTLLTVTGCAMSGKGGMTRYKTVVSCMEHNTDSRHKGTCEELLRAGVKIDTAKNRT